MKHVEMIIDYIVQDDDFKYNDNKGLLIRCYECKYYDISVDTPICLVDDNSIRFPVPDDYCSLAMKE